VVLQDRLNFHRIVAVAAVCIEAVEVALDLLGSDVARRAGEQVRATPSPNIQLVRGIQVKSALHPNTVS
jgi:hypothetical protein